MVSESVFQYRLVEIWQQGGHRLVATLADLAADTHRRDLVASTGEDGVPSRSNGTARH